MSVSYPAKRFGGRAPSADHGRGTVQAAKGPHLWLNGFNRSVLGSPGFRRLLGPGGLCGMTWEPRSLASGVATGIGYKDVLRRFRQRGQGAEVINRALTVQDVQTAADLMYPLYNRSMGQNGVVSVEVHPELSYDADGVIEEARMLWAELSRPNIMIQIHATRESLPAIRQLTVEGVNLSLASILSVCRYREAAAAHREGLIARNSKGLPLENVNSFACLRSADVGTAHDALAKEILGGTGMILSPAVRKQAIAATAVLLVQTHVEVFGQEEFGVLEDQGARALTPVWIENSSYPDRSKLPDDTEVQELVSLLVLADESGDESEMKGHLLEEERRVLQAIRANGGAWTGALEDAQEELIKARVLCHDQLAYALEKQTAPLSG